MCEVINNKFGIKTGWTEQNKFGDDRSEAGLRFSGNNFCVFHLAENVLRN